MASTNVESALNNDDDQLLRQIYGELSIKIQPCAILSDRKLHRDFDVEMLSVGKSVNNVSFDLFYSLILSRLSFRYYKLIDIRQNVL